MGKLFNHESLMENGMISGRHTSKNTNIHTKLHEAVSGHKLYALKKLALPT